MEYQSCQWKLSDPAEVDTIVTFRYIGIGNVWLQVTYSSEKAEPEAKWLTLPPAANTSTIEIKSMSSSGSDYLVMAQLNFKRTAESEADT